MSMFNGFLSGLASGDQVKITQKNGQVIVGTVTANDGEDSIMLSVSTSVIMRYGAIDSISVLSHMNGSETVMTDTVQSSDKNAAPPKKKGDRCYKASESEASVRKGRSGF